MFLNGYDTILNRKSPANPGSALFVRRLCLFDNMEEPSVKGFTVRTASGSIRDLGTVFGVRVDKAGADV